MKAYSHKINLKKRRTGKPIKLMIGFNARDSSSNPETLVPVKLYVKPQLQQRLVIGITMKVRVLIRILSLVKLDILFIK